MLYLFKICNYICMVNNTCGGLVPWCPWIRKSVTTQVPCSRPSVSAYVQNTWIQNAKVKVKSLSCVWLFATLWTVAHQARPSIGFSRQENWSGLPFPSPGDLPNPGIEPRSPELQADALTSETPGKPTECQLYFKYFINFHF